MSAIQVQILSHPIFWAAVVVCVVGVGASIIASFPGRRWHR